MASSFQYAIGSFTIASGTGSVFHATVDAITGVAFNPKGILFYGNSRGQTDAGGGATWRYGFSDGTTNIGVSTAYGNLESGESFWSTSRCILAVREAALNQQQLKGYVSSIGGGGFTVTIDFNLGNGATNGTVNYLAIGGTDVHCKVGYYTYSSSGNVVVTGVGFKPTGLLGWRNEGVVGTLNGPGCWTPGVAFGSDGCGTVGAACDGSFGAGVSLTKNYQRTDKWMVSLSGASVETEATIVSMDADGFTVNHSTSGGSKYQPYLAFNGLAVNVGSFTQPASTGAQVVPITAGVPRAVMFASVNKAASTSVQSDWEFTYGVSDLTTKRSVYCGALNGLAAPGRTFHVIGANDTIICGTPTGPGAGTINSRGSLTALANGSFTVNWSLVDGRLRQFLYFVLADDVGSGPCGAAGSGTLIVIKQTNVPSGEQSFDFTTTGGLSPSTFSLQNGENQTYSSLGAGTYGVTETVPQGWTVSYSTTNGDPHDAIVISANSVTLTVTNTFASVVEQLRRYRRFSLPYQENAVIFIPRLEIIAQMGVGNSDEPDPVMQMRFSKDGGETWSDYREMPFGEAGDAGVRAYLTRVATGRNLVAELICDDPVFVAWVQCNLPQGFTKGTS